MNIWLDQRGVVNSVELIIAATLVGFGLGAGLEGIRDAVNKELLDLSGAILSIDNSFTLSPSIGLNSSVAGSKFQDPLKRNPVYVRYGAGPSFRN